MGERREDARFWLAGHLDGLELLSARYIEHRFAPHLHDGYPCSTGRLHVPLH